MKPWGDAPGSFEIAPLALTVLYERNVDKCARFFGVRRHVAAF